MDLDKILLQFFRVVANDLTHKHYKRVNNLSKLYKALVAGVGLDDLLKQFVRREDEDLFEQRKRLTQHITTSVCNSLLRPFSKVPRSNAGTRVLTYPGSDNEAEKKISEVEGILNSFWGPDSWDDYMSTRYIELNATDPNSFVVFEFGEFDPNVELVQPYPYEVSSEAAVYYKKINKVLKYLISKEPHKYKTVAEGDILKTNDFNKITSPDKLYKDGYKYTLYTENQTFQLLQVHEDLVFGLSSVQEGQIFGEEDGDKYIKLGKAYYQFIDFQPHNLGRVPAISAGYVRDLSTNGETYVSMLEPAVPYLLKSIKTNSEFDLVATLLAMPQAVMYADTCPDENCFEGKHTSTGATCTTCNGSGKKLQAPSAQDAIILKMPESKEQMLPLSEILAYVAPPVDVVKWQEEYIDKLVQKCKELIFASDMFTRKNIAETATGKSLDMQNVYDSLYPFALDFGNSWKYGVEAIAGLADRGKDLIASYTFAQDLQMKTLDSLMLDLSMASSNSNAELIRHINGDIARVIFTNKPLDLKRYELKESHNPFSGKTEKEILLLLASNLVPRADKVLYSNFNRIFSDLEIEYAKQTKDFYKLKRLEQREVIYKRVEELIAALEEGTPAPDLTINQ